MYIGIYLENAAHKALLLASYLFSEYISRIYLKNIKLGVQILLIDIFFETIYYLSKSVTRI